MDAFAALAEPSRRRILTELRSRPRSVNDLSAALKASQPATSKHLKVLREAGFVSCRGAAQQRIYQLEPSPFEAFDAWLRPYLRLWTRHLDALERYLDRKEETRGDDAQRLPARRPRRRRSAPRR
jgi:DNA-binding transcriptional ArsR family regulator